MPNRISQKPSAGNLNCWPKRGHPRVISTPPIVVSKPQSYSDELEASRSDHDDAEKPLEEGISRSEGDQSIKSEERLEEGISRREGDQSVKSEESGGQMKVGDNVECVKSGMSIAV